MSRLLLQQGPQWAPLALRAPLALLALERPGLLQGPARELALRELALRELVLQQARAPRARERLLRRPTNMQPEPERRSSQRPPVRSRT
jgi:hypothetical protein